MGDVNTKKGRLMPATAAREKPIPLHPHEVRAILDGRQNQLRRVIKPPGPEWDLAHYQSDFSFVTWAHKAMPATRTVRCPFGQPGDLLWVRETWADYFNGSTDIRLRIGDGWERRLRYKVCCDRPWESKWRPSIHMPRWASRLTLEVTDVRVERLQSITEEDAEREVSREWIESKLGRSYDIAIEKWCRYSRRLDRRATVASERGAFAAMWDSINAKSHPWDSNPWVFVVSFKPV